MDQELAPVSQPQPQNLPDDVKQEHATGLQTRLLSKRVRFVPWLKELFTRIENEGSPEKRGRWKKWARCRHFYRGEQHLTWRERAGCFKVTDIDDLPPNKVRKFLI